MKRNILAFAMLLLFVGSSFAGTTVSVGETVPVGGTTTTTTTTTTTETPPEPEEGEDSSSGSPFGGVKMTNDEGESIVVGKEEGTFEVAESGDGSGETPGEPAGEAGTEEGSLTFGLPEGEETSTAEPSEQPLCGTAFVLLTALAAFACKA